MESGAGRFRLGRSALAAAAVVLLLALSGVLERTDRWWFDTLQRFGAARAAIPEGSALVLIDEQSLAALGQAPFGWRWPWPRAAFAALLAGLEAAGAERVALDFVFFEHSAAAEQDALLGAVAAGFTGTILAATHDRLPVVWPEEFRARHPHLFADHPRWGVVDSRPDPDGMIRRYRVPGSLAHAALAPADREAGAPAAPVLLRWRGNLEQLRSRGVPLLPAAPFVLAGWGILDRASAAAPDFDPAVLASAIRALPAPAGEAFERVRGKTVFVGANAAATFDAIATPLGAPEPGLVLHWNAYANLRQQDFIVGVTDAAVWAAAVLVIILLQFAGRAGTGLRWPAVAAGTLGALTGGGSIALFFTGYWFAPALPVVAAAAGFTAVAVERFRLERERKREIQGWFGAYVSPEVVKRLIVDPHAIELGGEQRELTVLFSDIAGFTTLSERLTPPELVALINRFLEGQTECILERGGYLDKYIGDAVMAVFGSPVPLANHALAACRAALDCRAALESLNVELERQFGLRLGMRTGINTGEVVVGNVGSARKRNYTVLGDAVNLASRLEGANKETGTSILLGPLTASRVRGEMVLRPVARLQVKGKTQAVEVFELLGERPGADAATVAFAETFTRGFAAYAARRFSEAAAAFTEAGTLRPDDALSAQYLAEARQLAAAPPGPEWQAVLKLETK
jgi:adenylate cyclase